MARQIKWLGAQCECEELDGAGLCPACGIASALLNTHDNARLMQTMTGEWVWAAAVLDVTSRDGDAGETPAPPVPVGICCSHEVELEAERLRHAATRDSLDGCTRKVAQLAAALRSLSPPEPTAPPVPVGEDALKREERAHGQTIEERDYAQDMADELAAAIVALTVGGDVVEAIGEHTSANCPWKQALELAALRSPSPASPAPDALREALIAVGIERVIRESSVRCAGWGWTVGPEEVKDRLLTMLAALRAPAEVAPYFSPEWVEGALTDHVRALGCTCEKPLLGYVPKVGPRCRLCGVEPTRPEDTTP
jgi:hypothetical protein